MCSVWFKPILSFCMRAKGRRGKLYFPNKSKMAENRHLKGNIFATIEAITQVGLPVMTHSAAVSSIIQVVEISVMSYQWRTEEGLGGIEHPLTWKNSECVKMQNNKNISGERAQPLSIPFPSWEGIPLPHVLRPSAPVTPWLPLSKSWIRHCRTAVTSKTNRTHSWTAVFSPNWKYKKTYRRKQAGKSTKNITWLSDSCQLVN